METDAPMRGDETVIPTGLRTLWDEACMWANWLLGSLSATHLRTTGVNRTYGVHISAWLRDVEGAVRRLILAAAFALAPTPRNPGNAPLARKHKPTAARAAFRIFHLAGSSLSRRAPTSSTRTPTPYTHLRFAADPLLRLGAPRQHAPRPERPRRPPSPLDRHGRRSRLDPDWRPPEEPGLFTGPPERQSAPIDRGFFTGFEQYVVKPERKPNHLPPSLHDWRRHYDAWHDRIAAPTLAARLDALARVIARPAAYIAGTARRLHLAREQTLKQAILAEPPATMPRRARHIELIGHSAAFAERCHDALIAPDTS